jgi:phytoene synthase
MTNPNARAEAGQQPAQSSASAVMAASGKTFFQAARLLPEDVRDGVVALYAFCRYVDDLADESTQSLALRSQQLHDLQQALLDGQNEESTGALSLLHHSVRLSPSGRRAASVLVGAAREDLSQKQPQTEAELVSYAFGVAGTVGLMMAEVLGAQEQGTRAAIELGIAMQLSNIARDVEQDLKAARVYLPATWIASTDVERALIPHHPSAQNMLVSATLRLLNLADEFYDSAFTGFWTLPLRVRWSILSAALCYREIGVFVGKNIKASWGGRTIVPRWRKIMLIAIAGARLLLPKYWRAQPAVTASRGLELLDRLTCLTGPSETLQ